MLERVAPRRTAIMLTLDFKGPYALLPNDGGLAYLLADADAWSAGLYLWTFLHNKAHRVNFVGISTQNVAVRHNKHVADFLAGRRRLYDPDSLGAGSLRVAYRPEDGRARFIAEVPAMMHHLALLNVFFAPFEGPPAVLERIGVALAAHFQRLGGRAADWLDNDAVEYAADAYVDAFSVRLGRPAFIASLPDEMHI
jgi:hypothetical protein